MEDLELNRLLNQFIDGSITQGDFSRLQGVLRVDAEARQTYYELLGIDLMLAERYELPDHIAVQSQTMANQWVARRARNGVFAWSVAGAAAALVLTLGTIFFLRDGPGEVALKASNDSDYLVNEVAGHGAALKPGDAVDLKHGVVWLALSPYVEAYVEGPARLRLMDDDGNVEVLDGSAYFQISPGGRGFEVHTPAGIIRDIGTKFGVRVLAGGRVETHVTSGAVEIERNPGESPHRVDAGKAVTWTRKDPIRTAGMNADGFVQSLPSHTVVMKDDFNDPDGTPVAGKQPDFGQPWKVLYETTPSTITRGMLDTSFGPKTLSAEFKTEASNSRRLYLTTFRTSAPANLGDKGWHFDAAENLTLWGTDGKPLFSIVARNSRDHRWQLKDEVGGKFSIGTRLSALEENTLTLSYDHETGVVRLFDGPDTKGQFLDELKLNPGVSLGAVSVSNAEGGDLAIDELEVRVVTYPQGSKSGN